MINAHYFDGKDSNPFFVSILFGDEGIELQTAESHLKSVVKKDCTLMEPFDNAPLILHFADGSYCEIYDPAEKEASLSQLAYQPTQVQRWQNKWPFAIVAIILMVVVCYFSYQFGAPYLAKNIVPVVPVSVDTYLGDEVSQILEKQYFTTSKIDNEQFAAAVMVMRKIQPENWETTLRLDIPVSERLGVNALALPNGNIYVTDAMFQLMLDKEGKLTEQGKNELAAVLAHEIGHVKLRHAMHGLVQSSVITVLVGSVIGDFSQIVALGTSGVLNASYSRETEAEADEYAIALFKKYNISPIHLANLFTKMEKHHADKKGKEKQNVHSPIDETIEGYLSSHPSTTARIARFRQAAAEFEKTGR